MVWFGRRVAEDEHTSTDALKFLSVPPHNYVEAKQGSRHVRRTEQALSEFLSLAVSLAGKPLI